MSHLALYKAFSSEDTRGRVAMASLHAASQIINEDTTTSLFQNRRNLALSVLGNPMGYAERFTLECLKNPTVAASAKEDGTLDVPDGDLDYVLASVWSEVALDLKF